MTEEAKATPLEPEVLGPEIPPAPADADDATLTAIVRRDQPSADVAAIERRDASSALYDPGAYDQAVRYAVGLANSTFLPQALALDRNRQRLPQKTIVANCLFLVMDAQRWDTSPYALLGECFPKPGGGGLAYQGKVLAGIVQRVLKIRLHYDYTGAGETRVCRCWAHIPGDTHPETGAKLISAVEVEYAKAKTKDRDGKVKQAWTQDPDQKLAYSAATKWARRYAPELVTGIATAEELEEEVAHQPPSPAPGSGVPPSLAAFAGPPTATPAPARATTQEQAAPENPAPAAVATPAAAPATPPVTTPAESLPLSRQTYEELRKLAAEAGFDDKDEELNKLCWRVVHKRLPKLLQIDAPQIAMALSLLIETKNAKA